MLVDAGAGRDVLTLRPRRPSSWDRAFGVGRQPGWAEIAFVNATAVQVRVIPF